MKIACLRVAVRGCVEQCEVAVEYLLADVSRACATTEAYSAGRRIAACKSAVRSATARFRESVCELRMDEEEE